MFNNLPFVSIIVPCRNEEKYIKNCLKSLAEEQTYPKKNLEILVIDGDSEDETRRIIEEYREERTDIKIRNLDNPKRFVPFARNIGLDEAKGAIIIQGDAHTEYQPDYIAISVNYLMNKYEGKEVHGVGGIIVPPSLKDIASIIDDKRAQMKTRVIALCLSSSFGSASSFRTGIRKPRFVDTIFGGCYKKKDLGNERYNEKLSISEDIDFNLRLRKKRKNLLLVPEIRFKYYPKMSFKTFFLHNFRDGVWATYPLRLGGIRFQLRHYIPLFFVLMILGGLISGPFFFFGKIIFILTFGIYLLVNLLFSLKIALKEDLRYLFFLLLAFFSRHFGYGLGSLWGIIKIVIS